VTYPELLALQNAFKNIHTHAVFNPKFMQRLCVQTSQHYKAIVCTLQMASKLVAPKISNYEYQVSN